jgi:hypothetical protein
MKTDTPYTSANESQIPSGSFSALCCHVCALCFYNDRLVSYASKFLPHTLSSGLSGTGAHGVAKIFAPGQEALASGGSASSFSPGHEKP